MAGEDPYIMGVSDPQVSVLSLCIFSIPVFYSSFLCCLPVVLSCHFLDLKTCKFKCIQLLAEIIFEGNLAFIFFSKLAFTWSVKYLVTGEMAKVRRKARPVCKKQLKTMLISMPYLPGTLALKFFLLWALDMIWKWGPLCPKKPLYIIFGEICIHIDD